jgi:hypothetical protein
MFGLKEGLDRLFKAQRLRSRLDHPGRCPEPALSRGEAAGLDAFSPRTVRGVSSYKQ